MYTEKSKNKNNQNSFERKKKKQEDLFYLISRFTTKLQLSQQSGISENIDKRRRE